MRNKIKLVLTLGVIFISSFLFIDQVRADTCWGGDCKATCSANEELGPPGADCSESYEICCVPKSCTGSVGCVATSSCEKIIAGSCSSGDSCCDKLVSSSWDDSCENDFNSAPCQTTSGESGFCKGGSCDTHATGPTDSEDLDDPTSSAGWNSDDLDTFGLPEAGGGDAGDVIMNVLDWLLTIVGIVAIIAFVISGFQYFMVASDEKMMERAKKTMTYAIIGLVVALSGFIVIQAIDSMLNTESFF